MPGYVCERMKYATCEESPFDREADVSLFSARTYKVEGNTGIASNIQNFALFLFDTGAGPNPHFEINVTTILAESH